MSDLQSTTPPTKDTPPAAWKVSWAAILTAIPGFLALAPEIAQYVLPFVPEKDRPRVLAMAALIGGVTGLLLNRKATSNLAGFTLPLVPAVREVERKAVVAKLEAERVAEDLARNESGLTADLLARGAGAGTGNLPPSSTPIPGSGGEDRTRRLPDLPRPRGEGPG